MLGEEKPVEEPADLTTLAPKRGIKGESFQRWFRGSKVVRADETPLPVYHASATTADLQPKSYGTAGEHRYFYFALSKAWARNFAREEGGSSSADFTSLRKSKVKTRPKADPFTDIMARIETAPIEESILIVRGQRVILAADLAKIYGFKPACSIKLSSATGRDFQRTSPFN